MANSICGSMKTLAVSLEKVGATNDIIANTNEAVHSLRFTFKDDEPVVKLNAPVVTEIEDMPIFQLERSRHSATGKWVVECILNWDYGRVALEGDMSLAMWTLRTATESFLPRHQAIQKASPVVITM